jgi:hypothetical protein
MASWKDDDDWVGTPPEGRYTRDRAKPEYWRGRWAPMAGAGLGLVLLILVIAIILR